MLPDAAGCNLDRCGGARSAYVHVPFCLHRCGYCDFSVTTRYDDLVASYLDALSTELGWLERPQQVDTLFLGGGTPTFLKPLHLVRLLNMVRQWFDLARDGEFSVEANPGDLDAEKVTLLAGAGVTRLSLGAQSFQTDKLHALDRRHSVQDIYSSFNLCRSRFRSVALDLIFAAPGEGLAEWRRDIRAALDLQPDHISVYGLTIEKGTAFYGLRRKGLLRLAPEELERSMYCHAIDSLCASGFEHYEVSNFARHEQRCRHNQTYWLGQPYYGVGPGAAMYLNGVRAVNHRSTTTYMRRVLANQSPVAESEELSPEDRSRELLVLGLRMTEGVQHARFQQRTGRSIRDLVGPALDEQIQAGMLYEQCGSVRLTRAGLLVSDSIWPHFLRV